MNVRRVLPRDAIPSVDDPSFGTDYFGDPDDHVLVLERGDGVRAYPLRILDFHEIVNDSIGGQPVAVTWCPLCGAGVVYDREAPAAATVLSFGVSGKLADDDLVMYDREDLHPKTVVLGVEDGDAALGFPRPRLLAADGVGSAAVGERDVVAFATPDGVHGFADPGFEFETAGEGRFRAGGTVWEGSTGRSEDGRRLERVPTRRLFAFAWQDDHGPDAFWSE